MAYNTFIPIVNDGLVFHVDAYNRKSYVDGSSTTNNLTLNTITGGTLVNGVGFSDKSWSFDGVNDYIEVPSVDGITNFTNNDDYTVSFWVKMDSSQGGNVEPVVKWDGIVGGGYPYIFRYFPSNQGMRAIVNNGTSSNNALIPISHSTWWHITGVYDWTNSTLTIYGNGGEVVSSDVLNLTGNISNNFQVQLMNRDVNPITYGKGNISSLKIYNRALSADEVLQNYNATKWRFQ